MEERSPPTQWNVLGSICISTAAETKKSVRNGMTALCTNVLEGSVLILLFKLSAPLGSHVHIFSAATVTTASIVPWAMEPQLYVHIFEVLALRRDIWSLTSDQGTPNFGDVF